MYVRDYANPRPARAAGLWAVNCDLTALRFKLAGWKYRRALILEMRFNPNHDELGRFTFADGAASGGVESNTVNALRTRIAQAQGGRRSGPLFARWPDATPAQQARLAVADVWARDAIAQTRARDPGWKPVPSLTSSIEGEISQAQSEARQAETRLADIEALSLGGARAPSPGRTPRTLEEVCFPDGNPVGVRIPAAKPSVRTLTKIEFSQVLRESTRGATESPRQKPMQGYGTVIQMMK
jgi:hypothetical protein